MSECNYVHIECMHEVVHHEHDFYMYKEHFRIFAFCMDKGHRKDKFNFMYVNEYLIKMQFACFHAKYPLCIL